MKETTKPLAKRAPMCKDTAYMNRYFPLRPKQKKATQRGTTPQGSTAFQGCVQNTNQRSTPSQRSTGLQACVLNILCTGALACATLFTSTAPAAVAQFDASRNASFTLSGNTVQEWRPVRTGPPLTPLHGASNGWDTVTRLSPYGEKPAVSFTGDGNATPSPLTFMEGERPREPFPVSTVFAVIKCETPVNFSTLIDAPVDIRLTTQIAIPPPFTFSEEQLGYTVTYRINGTETANFTPSASYQLIEVSFGNPPELSEIFIGGSIPAPHWKRNWRGEIAELLFFPSPPSPEQRNAVHHYLSLKWGVNVPYTINHTSPALLASLGIATGGAFNTLILIR